jgi:hypothetical protein
MKINNYKHVNLIDPSQSRINQRKISFSRNNFKMAPNLSLEQINWTLKSRRIFSEFLKNISGFTQEQQQRLIAKFKHLNDKMNG